MIIDLTANFMLESKLLFQLNDLKNDRNLANSVILKCLVSILIQNDNQNQTANLNTILFCIYIVVRHINHIS